jgi:hypothetical protein
MKQRIGRRPLPTRDRKAKVLCARTDLESYRIFRAAADASGMSMTEWIRDRLRRAAERDLAA